MCFKGTISKHFLISCEDLTLLVLLTSHLADRRILVTPAWPYLEAVWRGVSPY